MWPETETDIVIIGTALMLGYPRPVGVRLADMVHDSSATTIRGALRHNAELKAEYDAGGDTRRILDFVLNHSVLEI